VTVGGRFCCNRETGERDDVEPVGDMFVEYMLCTTVVVVRVSLCLRCLCIV